MTAAPPIRAAPGSTAGDPVSASWGSVPSSPDKDGSALALADAETDADGDADAEAEDVGLADGDTEAVGLAGAAFTVKSPWSPSELPHVPSLLSHVP